MGGNLNTTFFLSSSLDHYFSRETFYLQVKLRSEFIFFWYNKLAQVVEDVLVKVFDIKREEVLQLA